MWPDGLNKKSPNDKKKSPKNRQVSFYLKSNIFVAKKHKYVNLNAKKACFLTAKASQSDF